MSAMEEEYYIRTPDSEVARGPFNLDKLITLAEAGQVTRDTLYYDEELESWAAIGSNEEFRNQIFPERKKLALKAKAAREMDLLNPNESTEQGEDVSVDEMLAAAEGQTRETRHLRERIKWAHRAASFSIPTVAFILLISALTYIYPSWHVVDLLIRGDESAGRALLTQPFLILGVVDLGMALLLLLAATEIYPLVRFRIALGTGFFGFSYWAGYVAGDEQSLYLMIAVVLYGVGVFAATLTLRFTVMLVSAIIGIAGVAGFAVLATLLPLLQRLGLLE